MKKILVITAMAAALYGCNTGGCFDNRSAIPLADFYSSSSGKQITLSNIRIAGEGAPADTAVLIDGRAANSVYLPMRSSKRSTAWIITYSQPELEAVADRVELFYTSMPYFASSECGAFYNYHIDRIESTTNVLDSVVIVDSLVTNIDKATLRFYFRTADSSENPDKDNENQQ